MKILLNECWKEKLLSMPETGMSYHIVDVFLKDGRVVSSCTVVGDQLSTGAEILFQEADIKDLCLAKESSS